MARFRSYLWMSLVLAFVTQQRAAGSLLYYTANLSGLNEVPPNASPGTGFGQVTIDTVAETMRVQVTFSGLLGPTTASHIHSPALPTANAMVATQVPFFTGFPLGVTSGSYDQTFDLTLASTYNPSFITANGGTAAGAELALRSGLFLDRAYLNVHSSSFPGGELRGNLALNAAPEPGTISLAMIGAIGLLAARKFRR